MRQCGSGRGGLHGRTGAHQPPVPSRAQGYQAVLGQNLRRRREALGLNQEQVAQRARVVGLSWTRATVAAVELGRRSATLGEALVLQGLLNIPLAALLEML